MIGRTLGHCRLTAKIGHGGMGEIYRAHDSRLDRDVAIPVMPAEVARDPERQNRFEREARAVATLLHPNIVAIYGFGVEEEVAFAILGLLEGQTLAEEIRGSARTRHSAPRPEAVRCIPHLLRPAKILDFGLAKSLAPAAETSSEAVATNAQTAAHEFFGTVAYTAAERFAASNYDQRSDLFSLGIIVYEMLTGKDPFAHPTLLATVSAILTEEPLSPHGVSSGLAALVWDCLKRSPAKRIGSARELEMRLVVCRMPTEAGAASPPAVDSLIAGLTDSVIANLSQLPQLKVMPRSTVFRCQARYDHPVEVDKDLGFVLSILAARSAAVMC